MDLNNDGKPDLVAVMQNNQGPTLAVYLGTGQQAGPFAQANPLNYGSNNANQTPQWMELGDLNNDGKIDCVVSDSATNTIRVFIGTGSANASFNAANNPVFVGAGPQQLTLGDANGDYAAPGDDGREPAGAARPGAQKVMTSLPRAFPFRAFTEKVVGAVRAAVRALWPALPKAPRQASR
jgi:hypothetical protein